MPKDSLSRQYPSQEQDMDKNRIKGAAEQAKGKVKETFGKVTGDTNRADDQKEGSRRHCASSSLMPRRGRYRQPVRPA